jgi:hypothetical protein
VSNLISLARKRFKDLTAAEIQLLTKADKGEFAVCGPNMSVTDPGNDPSKAEHDWGEDRSIHANLIRWMCVDRQAKELVDPKGIQIYGAKILDTLDLSTVVIPFPFFFARSRIMAALNLIDADILGINLDGTWVHSILADSVTVKGNVFLRTGFHAIGGVRFPSARIAGFLDCSGGSFENSSLPGDSKHRAAFNAGGAIVGAGVFLRDGFHAKGEVRLHRVQVRVDLDCTGGKFMNPADEKVSGSGYALTADGAEVGGAVSLCNGFHAKGEVRLLGAQIGSNLYCLGSTFENPIRVGTDGTKQLAGTGIAINADGVKINGGIFFRDDFHAKGQVRLARCRVGLDLTCNKAEFNGELFAEGAKIGSALFWINIVNPRSAKLDFMSASAVAIVDDIQSWPQPENLRLDGFVYERIFVGPQSAKERLDWIARQKVFASQPYRQLSKVLRAHGDDVGAQTVLYEMERRRRQNEDKNRIEKFWSNALRWTIGYGYHPVWAIRWLLGSVFLGFVLYCLAYASGNMVPCNSLAYDGFKHNYQRLPPNYERFHASIYSLENAFPIVKLGEIDNWQPDPSPQRFVKRVCLWHGPFAIWISIAGFLRWFRWLQILFGWFFTTMFIAGVTGLVRRD